MKFFITILAAVFTATIVMAQQKELQIEAPFYHYEQSTGEITAYDGVTITYGPTTIYADEITYTSSTGLLEADGNVRLVDPDGEIDCIYLILDLTTSSGAAYGAQANTPGAHIKTSGISLSNNQYFAYNVRATTCDLPKPHYEIRAKRVKIIPGREIIASNVHLYLFGKEVFWLPTLKTSIGHGKQSGSIQLPTPSFDSGRGVSVHWEPAFHLGESLYATGGGAIYERSLPESRFRLVQGLGDTKSPLEAPLNEEADRFNSGYMDQIMVDSVADEERSLKDKRSVVFVEHSANEPVYGRNFNNLRISKDYEAGIQSNFNIDNVIGQTTVRVGRLREMPERLALNRIAFDTVVTSRENTLNKQFSWRPKLEFAGFAYEEGRAFGWVRPQAELYYRANKGLGLGLSYVRAERVGNLTLQLDDVDARESLHLRIDFTGPRTRLEALIKYDTLQRNIFDVQVRFGQVFHCLEPIIIYRMRPQQISVGLNIVDVEKLQKLFMRRAAQFNNDKRK